MLVRHAAGIDCLLARDGGSALLRDEAADLVGRCEDHVGAVAEHPGRHQRRGTVPRTLLADIGPAAAGQGNVGRSFGRAELWWRTAPGIQGIELSPYQTYRGRALPSYMKAIGFGPRM